MTILYFIFFNDNNMACLTLHGYDYLILDAFRANFNLRIVVSLSSVIYSGWPKVCHIPATD